MVKLEKLSRRFIPHPIPHIVKRLTADFDPKGAIPIHIIPDADVPNVQDAAIAPLIARIEALEAAQ